MLVLPVTCPDIDVTSKVIDTMSYLSYRDIIPVYYDIVLAIKNIRDAETAEMPDIIRGTRTYLTAYAFGWASDFRSTLTTQLISGKQNLASLTAKEKDKIQAEFDKAMQTYVSDNG